MFTKNDGSTIAKSWIKLASLKNNRTVCINNVSSVFNYCSVMLCNRCWCCMCFYDSHHKTTTSHNKLEVLVMKYYSLPSTANTLWSTERNRPYSNASM